MQGSMTLEEFMSAGGAPPKRMSLEEFMADGGDVLNGDLSQTEGFNETSPEWQAQMAKLQEGWRDASQPDPAAEQAATEWWDQQRQDEAIGELPADATELERLTFNRRRELITEEPTENPVPALQEAYDSETDPALKRERLVELQVAKRRDEIRRAQLAGDAADARWTGISPDQKIMQERMQVEAGLGPDMALANAPIMRGAMTGVQNAASGVAEAALRLLPGEGAPSDMADKIGRQRAAEGQRQGYLDQQQGSAASLANAVTQMTGEYLPLAAAGVPAPLQVGAKGMNDAYLQSDDDGYALTSGIVQGALTYAGGKLAGGTFIDMLSGKVAGKALGPMLKGFGAESVEELGQLYGQAMIDRGFGVGDGRMPTLKEAMWTLAVVAGARGVGTAMSANIEDDGVKQPSVLESLKSFSDRKWPSRKAAKEAGVDQVATTAKERSELAADIRKGVTAQQFTEQLRAVATSPEEADALLDIYKARAESAGETFDDYVGKRIKGIEKTTKEAAAPLTSGLVRPDGRRGEIEFLAEGTAIIRAFETQSVATLAHETGHLFRRDLLGDDLETAGRWAGAKNGKWNRKAEEKFARGFERYLRDGTAPTTKLASVFAKFKDWLSKVYSSLAKSPLNVEISPEIRGVFDRLLTPADMRTDAHQVGAQADTAVPDVAPGFVRFYHGGNAENTGKRWFSQERKYAEGYANKSPGAKVFYVDLPESHPLLKKAFDDEGTTMKSPYVNFEAPVDIAQQAKPIDGQPTPDTALSPENPMRTMRTESAPPAPDILSQAPVSPDLAAKNASMDEARAAMGLPEIDKPAAPGANMPHHVAEAEAIRQRIPSGPLGL